MEAHNPAVPAKAGERLMTAIIDDKARLDPQHCFMSIPRSLDLSDGLVDVTYLSIARAIDRCAWWMHGILW